MSAEILKSGKGLCMEPFEVALRNSRMDENPKNPKCDSPPAGMARAPFRLAIRGEGSYVNAYFARQDSMDGAILLGSILRSAANQDRKVFDRFKAFMGDVLNVFIKSTLKAKAVIREEEPPVHEREGHIPAVNDAELALSRKLGDITKPMELALRQVAGERVLYTLVIWGPETGGDFLSYRTNADRESVIAGLKELLGRFERNEPAPPVHERQ